MLCQMGHQTPLLGERPAPLPSLSLFAMNLQILEVREDGAFPQESQMAAEALERQAEQRGGLLLLLLFGG